MGVACWEGRGRDRPALGVLTQCTTPHSRPPAHTHTHIHLLDTGPAAKSRLVGAEGVPISSS